MSTIDEHAIRNILAKSNGTLETLSNYIIDECQENNLAIFHASSFISDLISTHQIQDHSRYLAVFFLLYSYHQLPPENNPFIKVLLEISQITFQPLERVMIADILLDDNINKHLNFDVKDFQDLVLGASEIAEERPELKEMREKIAQKSKEFQLFSATSNTLIEQEQTNNLEFLTPIPDFIKISNSQFHWLSPGIISDIQWDNTADIEKRMDKARKIFFSSLDRVLEPQERSEIIGLIDSDPYCPLQIGFKKEYLRNLVNNNPYLASALIIKVAKTPMLCEYLEQFLRIPTTVQIFDAICRITKDISLPKGYITFFCQHHIKKIIKSKQEVDDKKSVAATLAAFLQCMFQNDIFSALEIKKPLLEFMSYFEKVIDFPHLRIILEKSQNR